MDILVTGSLAHVTAPLLNKISVGHTVVAAASDLQIGAIGKKITPFRISPSDEEFEKIFNSYNFRAAIYFSRPLFSENKSFDEYGNLSDCLKICSKHDVNQVIYVKPKVFSASVQIPDNDTGVMLSACCELCEYYRKRRAMSVIVLNTPELYGYNETASVIGSAVSQAVSDAAIRFSAEREQKICLLSQKDMGELILRMIDNWTSDYDYMDVPTADIISFGELGDLFKIAFPTVRISYKSNPTLADTSFSSAEIRREYDWTPILSINNEIDNAIAAQSGETTEEKKGVFAKIGEFIKKHSFIVKTAELLLGFLLMELLNRVTSTTIQFKYIDFRLLYIVIMGTVHGMKTGLGAAGLASLSLLAASVQNHNNWSAVVYDIDSWLPFLFFFLAGAVTGYIKDRLTNDNKFLSEEKALLEEKYVLLNEFYASALKNKDKYKTQIMSYRNSYGRLFDVTRNLDSTVVDEVFNEALNALEDILDNHSVCIYRCQDLFYGRLIVCSKEISNVVDKSMRLSDFDEMTSEFKDGEVWVNRARLTGYPEYAMPIFHGKQLIAIITLQKVSYEQLAVYYENLIKIVCGLIKISLVRAIEYTNQIEDEMYIPGTRIMNTEYFREIIKVKDKMAQSGTSEYMLLHFNTTPETRDKIADRIISIIRTTDVLGLGKDGDLYLLLSQANQSNIKFVLKRLQSIGICFKAADDMEKAQ